jgi:hypothetical protein
MPYIFTTVKARTRNQLSAVLALAAGFALRWWLVTSFSQVAGDSLNYGDLAKNLVLHHTYGYSTIHGGVRPTIIRLPGYPLFLAACFRLFGVEHYTAVIRLQVFIDLASCILIAGTVRRWIGARAGRAALWLACVCPFTADYAAAPMSETLSIFCVALGFAAFARLHDNPRFSGALIAFIFAVSYGALLRPDGALLGLTLFPALFYAAIRHKRIASALAFTTATALVAAIPFAIWAARNERTFHVFQPLAPRYATEVNEYVPRGFNRWVATWCRDFASTSEIFWALNDTKIDTSLLPGRAFDSPAQRAKTQQLIDDYNRDTSLTPELDAEFGALAQQRTAAHPLRTHVALPLARLADMWLRPRTEMLPINLRWWDSPDDPEGKLFAEAYGALNALYLLLALAGLIQAFRKHAPTWLLLPMLAFVALRCALLLTLETPEPRYTLECFPIVFSFAAAIFMKSSAGLRDQPCAP